MSLKIQIISQEVINKSGTGKNQQPYSINEQIGYAELGGAYPEKIKVRLEGDQPPYAPGLYELSPTSFYVGRFGSLEVSPKLDRVGDVPKQVASK